MSTKAKATTARDKATAERKTSLSPPIDMCDRPLAAPGLISYRCKSRYGWCMIGATDNEDAMLQARRSILDVNPDDLQVWDGKKYVKVKP